MNVVVRVRVDVCIFITSCAGMGDYSSALLLALLLG